MSKKDTTQMRKLSFLGFTRVSKVGKMFSRDLRDFWRMIKFNFKGKLLRKKNIEMLNHNYSII